MSRTLVSSEMRPDVDVAAHITREGMTMAVHVSDRTRMTMALRARGDGTPPVAGMCDLLELAGAWFAGL